MALKSDPQPTCLIGGPLYTSCYKNANRKNKSVPLPNGTEEDNCLYLTSGQMYKMSVKGNKNNQAITLSVEIFTELILKDN